MSAPLDGLRADARAELVNVPLPLTCRLVQDDVTSRFRFRELLAG